MSKKVLNIGFITTVSGRWPKELPRERFKTYKNFIENKYKAFNVIKSQDIIVNMTEMENSAEELKKQSVDIVIMLYGAFTGDDMAAYLADELKVPLILWAPYEPEFDGGRLLANALVAVTMNAASLHRLDHKYHVIYGGIDDKRAVEELDHYIKVYNTIKRMKYTKIGLLGYRPTAFYNSTFDEGLIRRTFGVKMEETDLKVVFDKMESVPEDKVKADMEQMTQLYDISKLPEEHLENHARLYFALKEVINEMDYDVTTIKCWPEMGQLKTTPCAVMSRLADEETLIGCEGDVDAMLAAIAQNYLTNKPTFITDLINIDEKENTVTFWHCGQAARSLMDQTKPICLDDHPLAGQGTAFYASLKPGKVTIARFCNIGGVYRLFLLKGEAIPTKRNTNGVMVNVKLEKPVRDVMYNMFKQGVPHHYSVVWEDVAKEMIGIAESLGIEVLEV